MKDFVFHFIKKLNIYCSKQTKKKNNQEQNKKKTKYFRVIIISNHFHVSTFI